MEDRLKSEKIGKWNATISYNEKEGEYVIVSHCENGALVSSTNLDMAKQRFLKAMEACEGIAKIL